MASVPNTRAAPLPVATGKAPAAAPGTGFASQLAGIPEELLQVPASILAGAGDGTAPDGAAADGADTATDAATDAPSEAAQLAALAPLLQSLPAMVPTIAPTSAPVAQIQTQTKIETAAAKTPAPPPTALLPVPTPAPTPAPAGRIGRVKPESEGGEIDTETTSQEPTGALDAAARQALSTAKKVAEAALRAAQPALADATPKAAQAVTSALQTLKDALPGPIAIESKALIDDLTASATLASQAAPAPTPSTPVQPREATAGPVADRALDLANDAEWLDRLARDIAQASGNEGTIRFRLHPQSLGHLQVELSQGDHGTTIRLTADTEHARAILADAQPRLAAEARAQGVRIAETHVDLSGSDRQASGDPRRQDDSRQIPIIRTARDAAVDAEAPERPARSRSDRYA